MANLVRRFQSMRHVFLNTSWIFLGNVVWALMSFATSVVVSRSLVVADYGFLQLASTWFIFVQIFENIVHPNVARIEMLKKTEKLHDFIISIGVIVFSVNLIFLILVAGIYLVTRELVALLVLIMILGQLLKIYGGILYSLDNQLQALKSQGILFAGNFAGSAFRAVAALMAPSAVLQSFVAIVTNLVCLLASFAYVPFKISKDIFREFDTGVIKDLLRKSFPFFLVAMVSTLVYRQDILILGWFGLEKDIALYANAVKLSEPWAFVASGLISSMLPGIISGKAKSLNIYYRKLRLLFLLLFVISVILSIFVTLFADLIVLKTYGIAYSGSIPLLKVHIWSTVFLFYVSAQQVWEANESMSSFLMIKYLMSATVNFFMNIALIPEYGAMACAVSSLVTYFLLGFGFNFFNKKTRFLNFQFMKALFLWRL